MCSANSYSEARLNPINLSKLSSQICNSNADTSGRLCVVVPAWVDEHDGREDGNRGASHFGMAKIHETITLRVPLRAALPYISSW